MGTSSALTKSAVRGFNSCSKQLTISILDFVLLVKALPIEAILHCCALQAVYDQELNGGYPAKSSSAQSSGGITVLAQWQLPPKQLGRMTEPDPQT
jgi:hypothetical protein